MARLFAGYFLVPTAEAEHASPSLVYDEARSLNLDRAGRVAVEVTPEAALDTQTRRGAEREDRLRGDALLGTATKAAGEGEDFVAGEAQLGTETREQPEADDFARDEMWAGTRTFIQGEEEDFATDALGGVAAEGRLPTDWR